MPVPVPDADTLKDRYPAFLSVENEHIDYALDEAARCVGETWIEADKQPAILALAAHILTVEGHGDGGGAAAGSVASHKVGDVAVTFHAFGETKIKAGAAGSEYMMTTYGRRWLQYLRRNAPFVMVV